MQCLFHNQVVLTCQNELVASAAIVNYLEHKSSTGVQLDYVDFWTLMRSPFYRPPSELLSVINDRVIYMRFLRTTDDMIDYVLCIMHAKAPTASPPLWHYNKELLIDEICKVYLVLALRSIIKCPRDARARITDAVCKVEGERLAEAMNVARIERMHPLTLKQIAGMLTREQLMTIDVRSAPAKKIIRAAMNRLQTILEE